MAETAKEKEREIQLRQLRDELEEKILTQLPSEISEEKIQRNQRFEEKEITDPSEAKRVIEAVLFTASKPMSVNEIRKILKSFTAKQLEELIEQLKSEYETEGRSFRINQVAGGYEISTEVKYAPWIMKLELQKKAKQATQSALETLAILAYKQPMTRAEIEDLRGVDVSGVISTLLERNLIKVVGRKEVPGRPFLYGTTDKFLEHFGLKSIGELPDITEIKKLIESSIRKEELLGRPDQMIPVEQAPAPEATEKADENSAQGGE